MTVRRDIAPAGQAKDAGLEARGKGRVSDQSLRHLPHARKLAIAVEVFVDNVG